jgi:hypothetical protein
MLIYKDIFTGDEMCSDSFPSKLVDGQILEFTCKHVTRKVGDVTLAGANPSAEEADEGTEEAMESGIDLVLNHQLIDMTAAYGTASSFKGWIKEYMQKLLTKLKEDGKSEDEVKEFKTKLQTWVVDLMKKERFANLQFFCGSGENAADGGLGIAEYRKGADGNEIPVVMFVRAGLVEEKC